MLTGISITNIALIKKLDLDFSEGLNILSGETGAGKSIIIDSLNFVLGERADKTLIRHGESVAEVEASFYFGDNVKIASLLDEYGIEHDDGVVILRRTMNVSGRNDVRINGRSATTAMLKSISSLLCDIHGQHEHQSLLKPATHVDIVDSFGESEIQAEKDKYSEIYMSYKSVCAKIAEIGNSEERAREIDMLDYAIKEIDGAELYEGIEEEISSLRSKYQNAGRLIEAVRLSEGMLDGGEGHSAVDVVYRAYNSLVGVERYDNELSQYAERLESVRIELSDVASSLASIADGYEFNAEQADEIERKHDILRGLKRKYGSTVSEIIDYREKAVSRKAELEDLADNGDKLEEQRVILEDKIFNQAKRLSEARRKASKMLECEISNQLSELGMGGTLFEVCFADMPLRDEHMDRVTTNGFDTIEFLISPNKGEPLRPLSKIISGGEMSRFMLALKVIIASIDDIGTLVFDEIDTGISGKIAFEVAKKLYKISKSAQVIAVTHLPQLAAVADSNYLIEKKTEGDSTNTYVYSLSEEDKLKEISRLSGGVESSLSSEKHAVDLIDNFKQFKASL